MMNLMIVPGILVCSSFLISVCMKAHIECYVSQLPYVWYYVGVKSSFNMLVRNASPRRTMCFRFQMFSLSGPCELLFLLCLIAS